MTTPMGNISMKVNGTRISGLRYISANACPSLATCASFSALAPLFCASSSIIWPYTAPKSNLVTASAASHAITQPRLATALMARPTPSAGRNFTTPPSSRSR